tara:strand:- start:3370 stop:3843 length:474 start_codon:yes stop_codon:yes gene_type:complete
MASRVDYAVSATPVAAVGAAENVATETVAADLNQSIGGSGSIAVSWGDTLPTTFPTYLSVDTTANGTALNADDGVNDFIWIKNTGYTFGASATVLGDAVADGVTLAVKLGLGGSTICTLDAGAGILIPKPGTNYDAANDYYLTASAGTIAVEWAVGT